MSVKVEHVYTVGGHTVNVDLPDIIEYGRFGPPGSLDEPLTVTMPAEAFDDLRDTLTETFRAQHTDALDRLGKQVDVWKELAERNDTRNAPLRRELDSVTRQLCRAHARLAFMADWSAPAAADDVDELKAVIVSQAREIARLKGESE